MKSLQELGKVGLEILKVIKDNELTVLEARCLLEECIEYLDYTTFTGFTAMRGERLDFSGLYKVNSKNGNR